MIAELKPTEQWFRHCSWFEWRYMTVRVAAEVCSSCYVFNRRKSTNILGIWIGRNGEGKVFWSSSFCLWSFIKVVWIITNSTRRVGLCWLEIEILLKEGGAILWIWYLPSTLPVGDSCWKSNPLGKLRYGVKLKSLWKVMVEISVCVDKRKKNPSI